MIFFRPKLYIDTILDIKYKFYKYRCFPKSTIAIFRVGIHPEPILAFLYRRFGFLYPKNFKIIWLSNILALKCTWGWWFQKRIERTKLDIYVFISNDLKGTTKKGRIYQDVIQNRYLINNKQ